MPFAGMRAGPPNYRHLCHWEGVCRSLDSQPYRSVAYPFPSEPPISARLLKRMARVGLVCHGDTDCRWRLACSTAVCHSLLPWLDHSSSTWPSRCNASSSSAP
jgi:hypothetical protein